MSSSLPLLHSPMHTPCLNAFCHSDPYIFLQFVGGNIGGALILSEDTDNSTQPSANRETRVNLTRFSRLWRKQPQKSTPDGEKRSLCRSGDPY